MKRITYISRYAQPMAADTLRELGESAAEKNRSLDITGMLMASGGLFYQVLEGPEEAVDDLYSTIVRDDRHTDLLLLQSEENVTGRLYPDWSMKTVDLDAAAHVRLFPLKALIKATFDQQMLIRNMIWSIERSVQYEMTMRDRSPE